MSAAHRPTSPAHPGEAAPASGPSPDAPLDTPPSSDRPTARHTGTTSAPPHEPPPERAQLVTALDDDQNLATTDAAPAPAHPVLALDDVIHQRTRLGIMVMLAEAGEADFTALREQLALSDGNLHRQLATLVAAGYVHLRKQPAGRSGRSRTWARLTPAGQAALAQEMDTMRSLLALVDLPGREVR